MSKKPVTKKISRNDPETAMMDVNERILKTIHELYMTEAPDSSVAPPSSPQPDQLLPTKEGIKAICVKLGMECIAPRKKANVMIVGNHSAGKSSYINWYVGEHIQTTAVAIETQGFTFCTSGKKRETLKGEATLHLFDHLHELRSFKGITVGLQTEISTSKEKKFPMLNFIDTPGLVDGSFSYPFAVEEAIEAVSKHCDLIFIFFDPIGQALCDRTMNVVERLNKVCPEKIKYFLSKADTVPSQSDRQKVLVQITQNLSSRIRSSHAWDLPSLYIPSADGANKDCGVANALDETCVELERTINLNVQANLNKLERDCNAIVEKVDALLEEDREHRAKNRKAAAYGFLLFSSAFIMPLTLCVYFVNKFKDTAPISHLVVQFPALVNMTGMDTLNTWVEEDEGNLGKLLIGTVVSFLLCMLLSRLVRRYKPELSKKAIKNLKATQEHVTTAVLPAKQDLYKDYFKQSINADHI